MNIQQMQQWLNQKIKLNQLTIPLLLEDGVGGPKTRDAIYQVFRCKKPSKVTESQLLDYARKLGDSSVQRLKAIAKIETGSGAWAQDGLPRILYERHYFYRVVKKTLYLPSKQLQFLAKQDGGGYGFSWEKLAHAACIHPIGAFSSVSMSTFQVMGSYYQALGYATPLDMLYEVSRTEAAHYQLLMGYILNIAKIKSAFLKISKNPETNRDFAKRYNGANYQQNQYHVKLANAMR